jgi:NAD-dependent dihydropyrimidine dehydrogenase PreA subunit
MGMFIRVEVAPEVRSQMELARKLVEVCPVDIFALDADQQLRVVEENEDECVLCNLCIEAAPAGTVKVIRLYEEG